MTIYCSFDNFLIKLRNIQTSKVETLDDILARESKDGLKEKLNEYVLPFAKKDHLQRAEKKFAQLWEAMGFFEPERNAATVRSFNEQKEAFEVLLDWKREHGESK